MKRLFYLLITLSMSVTATAQVTIMGDVSYPYLDKLIQVARENYPKFKVTTAKVHAAKAAYDKTKFGIFDFATLSYIYYPNNAFTVPSSSGGSSSFLNGYQLGVFFNVGTMLQKPATIKQAKEEYISAQMDKEAADLDVEQEVRKRYFTYVQNVSILKLKTKALADEEDILKNVKYKFEKGETTFDLYNQSLLSHSTYSQEKIMAETNVLIAKTNLEQILGTTLENIK